jgi:hypothetical protein
MTDSPMSAEDLVRVIEELAEAMAPEERERFAAIAADGGLRQVVGGDSRRGRRVAADSAISRLGLAYDGLPRSRRSRAGARSFAASFPEITGIKVS